MPSESSCTLMLLFSSVHRAADLSSFCCDTLVLFLFLFFLISFQFSSMGRQADLLFAPSSNTPLSPRSPTCWRWVAPVPQPHLLLLSEQGGGGATPVLSLLCRQGAGRCRRLLVAREGKRLGACEGQREGADAAGRPDVSLCTRRGQSCSADC